MMSSTMSTTTPAVMVFPSDWKNAAIVFSFWFELASEKSLAPSARGGQKAARRHRQHQEPGGRERHQQPGAAGEAPRPPAPKAARRDERQGGSARERRETPRGAQPHRPHTDQ